MFTTKDQLVRRTPKNGVQRKDYLQLLVKEFYESNFKEAKQQVLANLANFSYDPINYEHIRELQIIDLFLDSLSDGCNEIVQYAIAGICNLALDTHNQEYILDNNGICRISELLLNRNEEVILNCATSLIFLINPESRTSICCPKNINLMLHFQNSNSTRLKNIATIFLEDYCTKDEVENVIKDVNVDSVNDIPVPLS